MNINCHTCDTEIDATMESFGHPDGKSPGDFCLKCYEDIYVVQHDLKQQTAVRYFLERVDSTPERIELLQRALKYPSQGAKNCHWASREVCLLLNAKTGHYHLPDGWVARVVRGFYTPEGSQHSWVEVFDTENITILDPTEWQFTNESPRLSLHCIEGSGYDTCMWRLNDNLLLNNKVAETPLEKAHWSAHVHPAALGPKAGEKLKRLQLRWPAMIPIETKIWFGLSKDPDADVHTRGLKPWKNQHMKR